MNHTSLHGQRIVARTVAALCLFLSMASSGSRAQNIEVKKAPVARGKKGGADSGRVLLTPRFIPGQTFRYEMEFETRTDTQRSGLGTDPQGPTSLVVNWNSTVRMEVLSADDSTPGGI